MTWTETTHRQRTVRDVLAVIEQRRDGILPWHDDWADVFGDPDGLVRALRYRWQLQREGQLDPGLDEQALEQARRRLADQNAGLIEVLARHADRRSVHVA